MKNYLILFSLVLILGSCSGGDTDVAKSGLKGDISSVTEHQYEAVHKNDSWETGKPGMYGHRIIQYDAEGNYVKSLALTHNGDTIGYTIVRKENGEKVEEAFHSLMDGRTTRTLMERVSDKQVNFEVWEGESLHYEGASYFDSKGRIVSQVRVVDEREVTNHFVYDKALMVKSFQKELSGEVSGTQLYEYTKFDENGNWTKRLIYLTDDRIVPEVITTRSYQYR
ncbi:MAG: hypothetical protein GY790_13065 [Bacteroidetes bacterium]|nr:hypothetical protein [Bacteroidota bacterium]